MSKKLGRAPKGAAPAPRIALCLAIVSGLYLIYFVGAMIYATKKHGDDRYNAAIENREMTDGEMTAQEKSAFIQGIKDAEADRRDSELDDWLQERRAKAFNKQLKGVWRTIPLNGEVEREFSATLYRTRFIVVSHLESDETAARAGVPGEALWSDGVYELISVPSEDAVEFGSVGRKSTFKVLPCRDVVKGHMFEDCMTLEDDGRLLSVAYRERKLTEGEATSQRLSVSRVLQSLERNGERRTFGQ